MNKKIILSFCFLLSPAYLATMLAGDSPSRSILANIKEENPSKTSLDFSEKPSGNTNIENVTPPDNAAPVPNKPNEKPKEEVKDSVSVPDKKMGSITIPSIPEPPAVDEKSLQTKQTDNNTPKTNKPDKEATEQEPTPKKSTVNKKDLALEKQLKEEAEEEQKISFHFEDATLKNLVDYIEDLYQIKFLIDDDIDPAPQNGALLKGHKLTFKTNKPLSRKDAWNLFLKFLDMVQLSVVPAEVKNLYHITTVTAANKNVIPTYFDTKIENIPDNSQKIRYVFFVKNAPLATVQKVVTSFSSAFAGPVQVFPDLNAVILTDKAANIRALMKIVQEFDNEPPEAMSVLKLKRTDAEDVAKLYDSLTKAEAPKGAARFLAQRKQPDHFYFPASARIIPEPRTNSLILLGTRKDLNKIEEFIVKHVDVELDMPYSPLHIYELQHTQADNIATILRDTATKFASNSNASKYGGVRDGDQYFGPMTITADKEGNRLIIKSEESDYLKLKEIIQKLDVVQPQVIIEVLIVDVQTEKNKALGTQMRNKANGLVNNVDFQQSGLPINGGFSGIVNATDGSLLGNLVTLTASGLHKTGSTVFSIGSQASGIWGVLKMLQKTSKTDVISNPFLLTTNNYKAHVKLGGTRRIAGSTISTGGKDITGTVDKEANLEVTIVPQISIDGSIQMSIDISIKDFSSTVLSDGNTITKKIKTAAIVKNREVLVLGGIVKDRIVHALNKVPILAEIPLLGWLFKSKTKQKVKSSVLVFISPQIIYPGMTETTRQYANTIIEDAKNDFDVGIYKGSKDKDFINRAFFDDNHNSAIETMSDFVQQKAYSYDTKPVKVAAHSPQPEQKKKRKRRRRRVRL